MFIDRLTALCIGQPANAPSLAKLKEHPRVAAYLDTFVRERKETQRVPEKFLNLFPRPASVQRPFRPLGAIAVPIQAEVISQNRIYVRDFGCRNLPEGGNSYEHHGIDLYTDNAKVELYHPQVPRAEKIIEWSGYFLAILNGDEDLLTKDLFAYAAALFVHNLQTEKP